MSSELQKSGERRDRDLKLWMAIVFAVIGAASAWGVTQQTVADHGRRLEIIELRAERRTELDNQILQRLTAIETKLEQLRDVARGK